jgi:hypothetical protein
VSGQGAFEDAMVIKLRHDPDVFSRPWIWLVAVMRQAAAAGDHHLVAAGLYWACYWSSNLAPRNNGQCLIQLELDEIADQQKAQILEVGVASARGLPANCVVMRDDTGRTEAGLLAVTADKLIYMWTNTPIC